MIITGVIIPISGKERNDSPEITEKDKLARLMEEIQIQMERIEDENNTEPLEVIKLFY